jgi:hypothetical protein
LKGAGGVCRFVHDSATFGPPYPFLICGFFPPADARPGAEHDNNTSAAIASFIGTHSFHWLDVVPWSPAAFAKDFPQALFEALVRGRDPRILHLLHDMRKELLQWVRDQKAGGNARPVVAWTGVVPNFARLWMEELDLLRVDKLSISGIGDYMRVARATVEDLHFLSAEDVIHPSAHLMDAGLSRAFTRTSFRLIHTLRMKPSAATCNILDELEAEELQRMQTAQHAYDALGIPHCKGWLQPDLRRLRGTPWQEPAVLNAFRRVKEAVGVPYFL